MTTSVSHKIRGENELVEGMQAEEALCIRLQKLGFRDDVQHCVAVNSTVTYRQTLSSAPTGASPLNTSESRGNFQAGHQSQFRDHQWGSLKRNVWDVRATASADSNFTSID